MLTATFAASCRKYFRCLKVYSKLIGSELLIIVIHLKKPKIEIHVFDRVILSGFAMKGFTTKKRF